MDMVSATQAGRSCPSISIVTWFGETNTAAVHGIGRDQLDPPAHARTGRHHAGEAHFVAAVVDAALYVVDVRNLMAEHRNQRQGQKAVGDRLAARHLALGALGIDMDPLVVAGGLGELVDPRLRDVDPVADADFLTHHLLHVVRMREFPLCHRPLLPCWAKRNTRHAQSRRLSVCAIRSVFRMMAARKRTGGTPWPTKPCSTTWLTASAPSR